MASCFFLIRNAFGILRFTVGFDSCERKRATVQWLLSFSSTGYGTVGVSILSGVGCVYPMEGALRSDLARSVQPLLYAPSVGSASLTPARWRGAQERSTRRTPSVRCSESPVLPRLLQRRGVPTNKRSSVVRPGHRPEWVDMNGRDSGNDLNLYGEQ